ncbi:deoxyguanosinetriphosphate triphosphohydrolase-like protein [Longispora fulva]|uniref:Deoxyguanosinetriphosphate triphosphohydrolase-like protein n=1 Tax=Longispora fulva TaxID=619741 RepID=A0A8J7GGG4_9ACTN|nr:deoxyguanosinetriphosphate triphosphohydrolase family protein [Longispora fulva]MBG6138534.1 dGTPase [Longispora fulva]GIG62360.1 deoxyguanosinetriphosphate triphosphohydrolase-like protein [Longispora fulva]
MDDERFVAEPPKDTSVGRSPYARDRARVLHSAAFRRLAAKTQVHTAGASDFPRTRLTHSLEVAQIGREMGERLGCDPDIVDTACLAHDLGHPPFGHNGEDALHAVATGCGGFEGNAQTLRVVARLEAKVPGAGLNLTRATLDAICKYPWRRRPGTRKFGVYADDTAVFDWVRTGLPALPAFPDPASGPHPVGPAAAGRGDERRSLEAQVMDWSDDVAYSVHDVEDGIHGGFIALGALVDPDERAALCLDVAEEYSPEDPSYLRPILDALLADPLLAALARYDGSHGAQEALKRATSVLTGRFVAMAVSATREEFGDKPLSRYAADLIVPRVTRAQCALLKGLALRYVMRRPGAEPGYARQRELLSELVHALTVRSPDALDPVFAPLWRAAPDDAARLRVVIDQVASLTDPGAVVWHRRLVG